MTNAAFVPETAGRNRGRIPAIDAARGVAMILVCLSHFGAAYLREDIAWHVQLLLGASLIATPTFVFISGMMLGLLYHRSRRHFSPMRAALFDRGLFLITIAHLAILGGQLVRAPNSSWLLQQTFITDTIGLSLLTGALLVDRLDATHRAALGVLLYGVNCLLVFGWNAHIGAMHEIKLLTIGFDPTWSTVYNFPLLPWLGVYLIGSAVGERMSAWMNAGQDRTMQHAFLMGGAACIAVAVLAKLLAWAVWGRAVPNFHLVSPLAYFASSPWQKHPPGPVYVLFFGGLGVVMLGTLFALMTRAWFALCARCLMLLGRASLFVFILQFYVYFVFLWVLHPPYTVLWPSYFALSIVVLGLAAHWWDSRRGNQYLTLHVTAFLSRALNIHTSAVRSDG